MSVTPSSCQQTILLCKSLSTQVERGERHPRVVRLNDVQVVSIVGHRAVGWSRPKLVKRMGNVYQTTLILDPDDRLFEGESTRHVFLKKEAHHLALSSLHFLRHNDGKILSRQCAGLKCTLHRIVISYTHLRAHETVLDLVCRLLLEKKKKKKKQKKLL